MFAQLADLTPARHLALAAAAPPPAAPDPPLADPVAGPAGRWRAPLTSGFLLAAGVLSAAVGLKAFLLPNHFFDGGVTGLSLLAVRFTGLPLSLFLVALNLPFIWLGYQQLGRGFALRTLGAIAALGLVLLVVRFPVLTQDKLLIAVFGGFFLGAGIGLAMRGGGVLDGIEIMAVYPSRRASLSVGDYVLGLNVLIFLLVGVVETWETALYSILTYLSASKTIEFVVNGIEEYTGVTIISEHGDAIRRVLTEQLGRGVTVYAGRRGYGTRGEQSETIDIVFTVITRLEVTQVTAAVQQLDPRAFIVTHSVGDAKGGMVKRRALH